MKYIIIFSTVFAVFGVILISGSLLMVPYTVREPVRVDRSKTWLDETFTLQPNTNRTYLFDSIIRNGSIFQTDLKPSSQMVFRITDDERSELVFEWLRGGIILWTPPSRSTDWRFVFSNPSSTTIDVSVTVTEYYLKIIDYKNVVYYRPVLDQPFGYIGIIAVTFGLVVNSAYNIYLSRKKRKSESTS